LISVKNWKYLYKLDNQGRSCVSQHTYEPLISPDNKIFCYHFCKKNAYSKNNLSQKTLDYFFENELYYLDKLRNYQWCPDILEIDKKSKKIFIRYDGDLINHVIYHQPEKQVYFMNKAQNVLSDLYRIGLGKISMHSHCFFENRNNVIKTIDFFSCFGLNTPLVNKTIVDEILSQDSKKWICTEPFSERNNYNFFEIYKFLLLNDKWHNQKLNLKLDDLESCIK